MAMRWSSRAATVAPPATPPGPLPWTTSVPRSSSTATPQACQAEWIYVDTVFSRQYQAVRDAAWKVLPGQPGKLVQA